MRDAFLDLTVGGRCVGCLAPGRSLCRSCAAVLPGDPADAFVARPDPMPPGMVPAVAASRYDGVTRRLILAHKERQSFGLARPLGGLLAVAVAAVRSGWPTGSHALLVPVPSRAATVRGRGHDPLRRIVRAAAADPADAGADRLQVAPLLRQRRRIRDQSDLDARGREHNLAEAFAVDHRLQRRFARSGRRPAQPVGAIICDDVLTTGSTAREAQRALEEVGIPVIAVAVVAATRLRNAG